MRTLCMCLLGTAVLASSASAQTTSWTGAIGSSGDWDDAGNWDMGIPNDTLDVNVAVRDISVTVTSGNAATANSINWEGLAVSGQTLTVNDTLTVDNTFNGELSFTLNGSSSLIVNGATTLLSTTIASGDHQFNGDLAINTSTFNLASTASVTTGGITAFGDSGAASLGVAGSWTNNGTLNTVADMNLTGSFVNGATGTFNAVNNFDAQAGSASTFTNNGTFNLGSGTANFDSDITFTNAGTISLGSGGTATLNVNGGFSSTGSVALANDSVLNATGPLTFASGTTLGGQGTVTDDVSVSGGAINPGNSPGKLTVNGALGIEDATINIEIGGIGQGTDYDWLSVSGDTTITGTNNTIAVSLFGGFTPDVADEFVVLTTNGFVGNTADLQFDFSAFGPGSFQNIAFTGAQGAGIYLSGFTAVPEPGSLAVLGLAGIGLSFVRRRKS